MGRKNIGGKTNCKRQKLQMQHKISVQFRGHHAHKSLNAFAIRLNGKNKRGQVGNWNWEKGGESRELVQGQGQGQQTDAECGIVLMDIK